MLPGSREIHVDMGLLAPRKRPKMYFGAEPSQPEFTQSVMIRAIDDALLEKPVDIPLQVKVTIEDDYCFTVEDNGPGLPTELHAHDPIITTMLTILPCGPGPTARGWGLGIVTAVCSEVIADVWYQGHHYHQVIKESCAASPLGKLTASSQHGTRLQFYLDKNYLGPTKLPRDIVERLGELHKQDYFCHELAHIVITDQRTGGQLSLAPWRLTV